MPTVSRVKDNGSPCVNGKLVTPGAVSPHRRRGRPKKQGIEPCTGYKTFCKQNGLQSFLTPFIMSQLLETVYGRDSDIILACLQQGLMHSKHVPSPAYVIAIIKNLPATVITAEEARLHFQQNKRTRPKSHVILQGDPKEPGYYDWLFTAKEVKPC